MQTSFPPYPRNFVPGGPSWRILLTKLSPSLRGGGAVGRWSLLCSTASIRTQRCGRKSTQRFWLETWLNVGAFMVRNVSNKHRAMTKGVSSAQKGFNTPKSLLLHNTLFVFWKNYKVQHPTCFQMTYSISWFTS